MLVIHNECVGCLSRQKWEQYAAFPILELSGNRVLMIFDHISQVIKKRFGGDYT